jgi:hypothetical protein
VQAVADHLLPSPDRRLNRGAPVVARGFLPSHAAALGDALEVTVALCWCGVSRFAGHRRYTRWHNYCRFRVLVGDRGVNAVLIVGSIGGERSQRAVDLVKQGAGQDAIVDLFAGQRRCHDLTGLGIHTEMQLPPSPAPLGAVLLNQPFACTA